MMYSKRLIDLRIEYNLKQYEVAQTLNLAPTTYSNYENEYETMPIKHLNTLSNYFNVSFDYLFSFTNIRNYEKIKPEINSKLSGERIKNFRKKNKLTQTDIAKFLNVDQTTISKYELGKEIISTNYIYIICKKYKLSADYLLAKINRN